MSRLQWPPPGKLAARGDALDDRLRRAARLEIAALVREADDRVGVADVDPLRVRSERIERDPERPVEAHGEGRHGPRAAVGPASANHPHAARIALGDEQVAVRRRANQPGIVEAARVLGDDVAGHRFRQRPRRTSDQRRRVVHAARGPGRGEIRDRDLVDRAGDLPPEVGERRRTAVQVRRLVGPGLLRSRIGDRERAVALRGELDVVRRRLVEVRDHRAPARCVLAGVDRVVELPEVLEPGRARGRSAWPRPRPLSSDRCS